MKGLEGDMLRMRVFVKESGHFRGQPRYLGRRKAVQDAGIRHVHPRQAR